MRVAAVVERSRRASTASPKSVPGYARHCGAVSVAGRGIAVAVSGRGIAVAGELVSLLPADVSPRLASSEAALEHRG